MIPVQVRNPLEITVLVIGATLLLGGLGDAVASAQAPNYLKRAEQAYVDVDMEGVLEAASKALEAGGHSVSETARIYELIGNASATLGQMRRAEDAYKALMGIDPNVGLDSSLPPRLRGPFLTARGFWRANPNELTASVKPRTGSNKVAFTISDPIDLAENYKLFVRAPDADEYEELVGKAVPRGVVELDLLDDHPWVEYVLVLLDRHGNRVWQTGATEDPNRLSPPAIEDDTKDDGGLWRSPWLWTGIGAVVLGGLATGAIFLFRGEEIQGQGGVAFP